MNLFGNYIFFSSACVCFLAVTFMTTADKPPASQPKKIIVNGTEIAAPPNCRKMMLVMAKKQMKIIKICFDEVKAVYPDKEEMNKHFQCVIKCALEKEQMLDENHTITNVTVQRYFEKNIPESYHEVGYKIMGGCLAEWGPKLDNNEPTCLSYGNFIKCLQEYVSEVC